MGQNWKLQGKFSAMARKVDIVSCMLASNLEEAIINVFLQLDGRSLAACSLVCKSWRLILRQRVWGNQKVKQILMAKLKEQWERSRPSVITKEVVCSSSMYMALQIVSDDELTLVGMKDGNVKVFRNSFLAFGERIRAESDEQSFPLVSTLDCRHKEDPFCCNYPAYCCQYHLQFWLGPEVIVTVGHGLVQCWNRQTFELEYRRAHHAQGEDADVYGVTVLGSGMVATGADDGEVVVLHKKEKWWKWLETGKDEGPIWSVKEKLSTGDGSQVCHMHTDPACNHTAIGTRRSITLWDLEQGCKVEGSTVVHQYTSKLVYVEPHAFVLGRYRGVKVWNLRTGQHVKHIKIKMTSSSALNTNREQIILSTGYPRSWRNSLNLNSCVVIFNVSELADPKVPAEEVDWREFLRQEKVGVVNVDAAIHQTGFVAVFPKYDKDPPSSDHMMAKGHVLIVKQFDFWRAAAIDGGKKNSLSKIESERSKNNTRREITRNQTQAKKKQRNKKHVL